MFSALLPLLAALLPGQGLQEAAAAPPTAPRELSALVQRDARVSFTKESARRSRALLDAPSQAPSEAESEVESEAPQPASEARAQALLTLGCAGSGADVPRLETLASGGAEEERRAALYALGELGPAGWSGLERALGSEAPGLEEARVVALLVAEKRGVPEVAGKLDALAQGDSGMKPLVRAALAYRDGGAPGGLEEELERYYDLRWSAARANGLVDGQRWQALLFQQLLLDPSFLDPVIWRAARELDAEPLKVHVLEGLLQPEGRADAELAAVRLFPKELVHLHESHDWQPASIEVWRTLLGEVESEHAEKQARKFVELAHSEVPELQSLCERLLLRTGDEFTWSSLQAALDAASGAERVALVEAWGEGGSLETQPDLAAWLGKETDAAVLAAGKVALARRGDATARRALEELVKGPASEERDAALSAMARVLHDRDMRRLADVALRGTDLDPELALTLEIAFAENGEVRDRNHLRSALETALETAVEPAQRLRLVRGLIAKPEPADLVELRGLFPVEADPALNVELCVALLRGHDQGMKAVLRAALWGDSWNRSVLAGGLIVRQGGVDELVEELAQPPRDASESDVRRVGFAIGEWGGIPAVEELARTHHEGDPALQGALLGALSTRSAAPEAPAETTTEAPKKPERPHKKAKKDGDER